MLLTRCFGTVLSDRSMLSLYQSRFNLRKFSSSFAAWLKTRSMAISDDWNNKLWLVTANSTAFRIRRTSTTLGSNVKRRGLIENVHLCLDCCNILPPPSGLKSVPVPVPTPLFTDQIALVASVTSKFTCCGEDVFLRARMSQALAQETQLIQFSLRFTHLL